MKKKSLFENVQFVSLLLSYIKKHKMNLANHSLMKFSILSIFSLLVLFGNAQCNVNGFTATVTNGTCFANGLITVQVPGAVDCTNWIAILTPPTGGEQTIPVPANGGPVVFSGLSAGNYFVRLFNGITTMQAPNNPIAVGTSYVNMVVSSTSIAPTCPSSAPGYSPNGALTINKTSGGIGPYVYSVTSGSGTQTFGPTTATSHTFNGMSNGEIVSISVVDQAGGNSGCQVTVSQTPTIASSTRTNFTISVPGWGYLKQCAPNCNVVLMNASANNASALQISQMLSGGNTTITRNGGLPEVLTSFNSIPMTAGDTYQIVATDGCFTSTFNGTVPIPNPNQNFTQIQNTTYTNCVPNYFINVSPSASSWCAATSVQVLLQDSSNPAVFNPIPGSPFNINPNGNNNIPVPSTGYYQLIYNDGCHSTTRYFTVAPPVNPLNNFNNIGSFNTLREGSGSIAFGGGGNNYNLPGSISYPVTVSIMPTSGATSLTYTATQPFQLAGTYTVNFPIVKTIASQSAGGSQLVTDIPGGVNYTLTISDACGNSIIRTYTPPAATYNPVITTTLGCNNSNSISYNLNSYGGNHAAITYGGTWPDARYSLHLDNGSGAPGALIPGYGSPYAATGAYKSATFNNLPSGNYVVKFTGFTRNGWNGCYLSETSGLTSCNEVYYFPVHIPVYQDVVVNVQSTLCDPLNANSGIIGATIVSGTPVYPLTWGLYLTSNPSTPIQTFTAANASASNALSQSFTGLSSGDYFVRTTYPCYSVDNNVNINSGFVIPQILASDTIVCPNTTISLSVLAPVSLYDIVWTNENTSTVIGNGSFISQTPSTTTTYSVSISPNGQSGCGPTAPILRQITIFADDTIAPIFTESLPGDTTVNCDAVPSAVILTATDNCSSPILVNYNQTIMNGSCANNYTITRTWTAEDESNNVRTHIQTITVQDTVAPTFNETLPQDTTVNCDAIPTAVVLTATDNCSANVVVNYTETTILGSCANASTITRTWSATDDCNNVTLYIQVITVQDTVAPIFVEALPQDTTVNCDAIPTADILTATDNCSATVVVDFTETTVAGSCANASTITRTWSAIDDCNNITTHIQVITVQDTVAPTFVEALPQDTTVNCDAIPTADVLTATDNCTLTQNVVFTEITTAGSCPNASTITRTWTAMDDCNNVTTHVQVITVQDTVAPIFVEALPQDTIVNCDAIPTADVLTATDNCTATVVVNFIETTMAGPCANASTISRTWTAMDDCNNVTTHVQVITVQDTVAPIFVEALPQDTTVNCDAIPTAVVLTATDNCSVTVAVNFTETTTAGSCPNASTITRTWSATDDCNNTVTYSQVITVQDTVAPIFVEALPQDTTVNCDAIPTADVLTATDNCTATITVNFEETVVAGSCANASTITRTWSATDDCNNTVTYSQVITVQDTVAPIFVEALPQDTTVNCDAIPTADVLTATDNCTTTITVNFEETVVAGSCANASTITRTWTAMDDCNNVTTHVQVITVQDTLAPIFVEALPQDTTVNCDAIPTADVLTATDNCTTTITVNFEETVVAGSCANASTITRTWNTTDDCNNTTTHIQVITVQDTVAPIFVEALPQDTTVNCDAIPTADVLTATDNCSATAIVNFTETTTAGSCANASTITRTWSTTDDCNNTKTHIQVITVQDTIAPVITGCPMNIAQNSDIDVCGAIVTWTLPTAQDNCGNVTLTASHQPNTLFPVGTTTVTHTATDECGNVSACSFDVVITDAQKPNVSVIIAENFCADEQVTWQQIVSDNCAIATVVSTHQPTFAFPEGDTEVSLTVTDIHGNDSTYMFTVTVIAMPIADISTSITTSGNTTCLSTDVTFTAITTSPISTYKWYFEGSSVATGVIYTIEKVTFNQAGLYTLEVVNEYGCISIDTFTLAVKACDINIFESFSPNGDGKNEFFVVENIEAFPNTKVFIYNRWGAVVYESDDYKNDWDGRSDNNLTIGNGILPEGTYYYLLELGGDPVEETYGKKYKGYVYIKR